jgi:hypothetical protein
MSIRLFALTMVVGTTVAVAGFSQRVTPPKGFTALYNGQDLSGWRGGDTFDHRKWLALPEAERTTREAEWTADMRAHWSADGAELVNDGKGKYATTVKEYGDFELLVDYKTVPLADSGIYLRGVPRFRFGTTRIQRSSRTEQRRAAAGCGTTAPARQARIHSCSPTSRSASGTTSAS